MEWQLFSSVNAFLVVACTAGMNGMWQKNEKVYYFHCFFCTMFSFTHETAILSAY